MSMEPVPHFLRRTNRLAARARMLYLLIPAASVILMMVLGYIISTDIANDSSRRLARQYSIEAASNFLIGVNPHFVLMQQLSRSTTISRWLANEHNPVSRAIAFEEIMGYVHFFPYAYVMFTVYETWHGYNFTLDLTPETFTSWGRLSGGEASQWFFDTRDAEMPFILNVQRTRPQDGCYDECCWELYIWSNHRMYYQGRLVGVATVGSSFDDIFYATFGEFDVNHKRGYIIDRNGTVRMDSAMLLQFHHEGLPTFPALPEAAYNHTLADAIDQHLQTMVGGIFQPGQHIVQAIPLSAGIYSYSSITPIIGTDWSVVVLSNHLGLFGGVRYRPLIYGAIAALVLSVLIGNLLIRHAAFIPLFKLTKSAAMAANAIAEKSEIFGLERNDEIGYLSRTIQFMRDNLNGTNVELRENEKVMKQTQQELKHREMLLNTVNQAATVLLTANEKDAMKALMTGMEILGSCLDVDRVQIWHDELINDELSFVMRYEWLSEVGMQKTKSPVGFKIPDNIRAKWLETFLRGECINGPSSKLTPDEAAFLESYDVISTAILPLFLNNEFFGFFGVGDCRRERTFTNDEMDMFASASLMFTSVYNRKMQRDLAFTDALTGAHNRRYLVETAEQELKECIEKDQNFSLIMIDIDHFKSINDRYGHACGDEVLKILTSRVRHILKHDTLFVRYGGEEFVVTLSGVSHEDAEKTAWRLQKAIKASAFRIGALEINVTASFGVASKTATSTTLSDIIHKADKALYRAKASGRNTVISYYSATA